MANHPLHFLNIPKQTIQTIHELLVSIFILKVLRGISGILTDCIIKRKIGSSNRIEPHNPPFLSMSSTLISHHWIKSKDTHRFDNHFSRHILNRHVSSFPWILLNFNHPDIFRLEAIGPSRKRSRLEPSRVERACEPLNLGNYEGVVSPASKQLRCELRTANLRTVLLSKCKNVKVSCIFLYFNKPKHDVEPALFLPTNLSRNLSWSALKPAMKPAMKPTI